MKLWLAPISIIVSLLIAFVAVPFLHSWWWDTQPMSYPEIVKWAGCTADVVEVDHYSPAGSYYVLGRHVLIIGTAHDKDIPYYAGLFILLHETRHCLQYQQGWFDTHEYGKETELDADRGAADLACGMGLNGRRILVDTFEWAHGSLGYNGDADHGTIAEREAQADRAHVCDRGVQVPLTGYYRP